jgi:hypothetical protein
VGSRGGGAAANCSTCRRAFAGQGEYVKVSFLIILVYSRTKIYFVEHFLISLLFRLCFD